MPSPEAQEAPAGPESVTWADLRSTAALGLIFVVTIAGAAALAQPFRDAGLQSFEDPGDPLNVLWTVLLILAFTAFLLYAYKKRWMKAIQAVILTAVGSTVMYVIAPLLLQWPGLSGGVSWGVGLVAGVAAAVALWKHPEWYVIDTVGVIVAAGAAAIFGISLDLVPVVLLLAALAVYDAIAVYKTRHMLSLADSVIELRLPVLLVIPKISHYRFREEAAKFRDASKETKGERDAMFMGLGDLVMPTILVVSSLRFGAEAWAVAGAWGTAVGILVGFVVLMAFVLRGNPQAGLPLLNGGAIAGFLAGIYATTGSIVFW